MQNIHLITTGGTIDKRYNAMFGTLDVDAPVLADVLSTACSERGHLGVSQFLQKDSLEITDEERIDLARLVSGSLAQRILVTHGTDTMQETARAIAINVRDKTVVLTGAMVPHSMANSDAEFNIGFAYAAVQILPPGVYIAMHGRVLPHTQYIKDRDAGRFVVL